MWNIRKIGYVVSILIIFFFVISFLQTAFFSLLFPDIAYEFVSQNPLFSWMGGPRGYFVHVSVNIVLAIFGIFMVKYLYSEYKNLEKSTAGNENETLYNFFIRFGKTEFESIFKDAVKAGATVEEAEKFAELKLQLDLQLKKMNWDTAFNSAKELLGLDEEKAKRFADLYTRIAEMKEVEARVNLLKMHGDWEKLINIIKEADGCSSDVAEMKIREILKVYDPFPYYQEKAEKELIKKKIKDAKFLSKHEKKTTTKII